MAEVILKVKILQGFKDAETQEQRTPDDVLDMTPDRYADAVASLARWPGKFLEVVGAVGDDVTPLTVGPLLNTPVVEDANPRAAELFAVAELLGINKPAAQMKTDELDSVAQKLGIDLSACKNNPERAAALNAWVEAYVKE